MKLLKPNMVVVGPSADHNMPCCVYGDRPAIYNMSNGIFYPSWKATEEGWRLVHLHNRLERFIFKVLFGGEMIK